MKIAKTHQVFLATLAVADTVLHSSNDVAPDENDGKVEDERTTV